MSKANMTADEALSRYFQHIGDIKAFYANRRRYDSLPWHKALAKSSHKCGTNEREDQGRALRSTCRALKKWKGSNPDLRQLEDRRIRAGASLLLKLVDLTERADAEHDEWLRTRYVFEQDCCGEAGWKSDFDRAMRETYTLLCAWHAGEDVVALKLAA